MKKFLNKIILILLLIVIIGCSNDGLLKDEYENKNQKNSYSPQTEAGKTFKSYANLMVNYAEKGVETVNKYVDLSQTGRGYSFSQLDELSLLLPKDLSILKRKITTGRGEETEISLDTELNQLVESFQQQLNEIKPNPTAAQSLSYCDATTDGVIIGGDIIVKNDNIIGAMTIELLNAEANGQSIESINDDLDLIYDDLELIQANNGRGHRVSDTKLWDNGVIYYYWGNISSDYKKIIKEAMNEWESKTNNAVKFQDASNLGSWLAFLINIHIKGAYTIKTGAINAEGSSNVGYLSGNTGRLTINNELLKEKSLQYTKVTCLHELGHMLGLSHEHQRWDRDEYVKLIDADDNKDTTNVAKKPRTQSGWRWENRWYKILWWNVCIPTWCYFTSYYSLTSGDYDYLSIMHYNGYFKAKKNQQGYKIDQIIDNDESGLSDSDINAVKRIY